MDTTDAQSLAGRGEALRAKVSNSRHKVDEAKSSLAADKSENAVLASLNKLKAQGRIKGFHVRILLRTGVAADVRDVWETLVLLTTSMMLPSLQLAERSTTSL
jgi:hypothetical protein